MRTNDIIPKIVVNQPNFLDFTQPETEMIDIMETIPITKLKADTILEKKNLDSFISNGYPCVVIIFIVVFANIETIKAKTDSVDK